MIENDSIYFKYFFIPLYFTQVLSYKIFSFFIGITQILIYQTLSQITWSYIITYYYVNLSIHYLILH